MHGFQGVAQDESVGAYHYGKQHVGMFGDSNRLDDIVILLLGVFAVHLNPAGITASHHIGMVAVNVDGAGQGPVDNGHNNR